MIETSRSMSNESGHFELKHQHQQQQASQHQQQQQQHQHQQHQQQQDELNGKPKRNPFCSRCRNHGKSAQVKGHKRHCEYRDCQCEGCKLVECRQIVSAAQIKRRRYQKQDEECGRRIEISPPVLTREPSRDPAALIAKTLIGSATAADSKRLMKSHSTGAAGQCLLGGAPSSLLADRSSSISLGDYHHPQLPQASSSAALSNALHLFHNFPSSVLAQNHHQQVGHQARPPPSRSLPSVHEQMNLVEDLHQTYGTLIAYAWLREEQFDLKKIRDAIEISRFSFEMLLQITGHSPLDLTSPIVD